MMSSNSELLRLAMEAASRASKAIMEVYESQDFKVLEKSDRSPLTAADIRAHELIMEILSPSGLPVLSEEGKMTPWEERSRWRQLWIVDPLDGTKEFLGRSGEFTVNIALVKDGIPVLGVLAVPALQVLYYCDGTKAFVRRNGSAAPLARQIAREPRGPGLRLVVSRSHMDRDTAAFLDTFDDPVTVSRGSSIKFMMVAEGLADIYPRFAPTMEWDTAAAHAILKCTGHSVRARATGEELVYNKQDLTNPSFVCS